MNPTIEKFGGADSLVCEYDHWLVMLRPQAVTLGSLVVAAKSDATEFSALPPPAFAELARVIGDIEAALKRAVDHERINYLMLMMVDRQVHFHALPRYRGSRSFGEVTITDEKWPKPPELARATELTPTQIAAQRDWLKAFWPAA